MRTGTKRWACMLVAGLGLSGTSLAKTLYVDADAAGANNGSSWSNAFTDLQSALAAVTNDEQIWVAEGTYLPTTGTNRAVSFIVNAPGVRLYGGFQGVETDPGERDWTNHVTVLSGDIGAAGVKTDNSFRVLSVATNAAGAILDGFTVAYAYSTNGNGAGLLAQSAILITNCLFDANQAVYGGAVELQAGCTISHCTFRGNYAGTEGGAIYSSGGGTPSRLINSVFFQNSSGVRGGAIRIANSHLAIMNCSFCSNSAPTSGRALYLASNGYAAITNTILWDGGAATAEIAVQTRPPRAVGADVGYSDIRGGYTPLTGYGSSVSNINLDPLFVGAAGGDLRLQPTSPCLDAGTANGAPPDDLDGHPRPQGDGYDMGAYETAPSGLRIVTVSSTPPGLTVTMNGVPASTPCQFIVAEGTNTIGTTSPQSGPSRTQYRFGSWSDGGAQTHNLVVTQDLALAAAFVTQYLWSASVFPWGAGDAWPPATWCDAGASFTASAVASSTWSFVAWSGDTNGCLAESNNLEVVMNQPRTLTARFLRSFPTSTWAFVVTGDGRGASQLQPINTNMLVELTGCVTAENPDVLIYSGDLVYSGNPSVFAQWTNIMAPVYQAGIGVYPVRGNHDVGDGWLNAFNYLPTNGPPGEILLTYSFTNRNALFVGLDQYVVRSRVNQPWLDTQLQANELPHVFVYGHEPAFQVYHVDCLGSYPADRNVFWDSLKYGGGRAYFCGHDHFYDHARIGDGDGNPSNDLHQLIAGMGGAPMYPDPGGYYGDNAPFQPTRIYHAAAVGYVLCEVNDRTVRMTWKIRTSANVYVPADIWEYTAALPLTLGVPAGAVEGQGVLTGAGSVQLSKAETNDVVVTLVSENTNRVVVPAAVTVPAGELAAAFDVELVDDDILIGPEVVGIRAVAPDFNEARREIVVEDNDYPIRYVAPSGGHRFPFAAWPDAATNIQSAVDAAAAGQTVLVSNGIYRLAQPVTVSSAVIVRSLNGAAVTTLDGAGAARCVSLLHANAVVAGFTIARGSADLGGGAYCSQPATIRDCVIRDNVSAGSGGGLYCTNGATVRNCSIYGNSADGNGGGIYAFAGWLAVENCTVVSNVAAKGCGGVRVSTGDAAVINTIVRFNTPSNYAGRITFTNSCTVPAAPGPGNTTNDPAFVNLAARDLRLQAGSPCIDSGVNLPAVAFDLDGLPRPLDGNADSVAAWDMGAYEFASATADTDGDGMPDAWELAYGLSPVTNDAAGDLDRDDFLNRSEYVAGTSPTNPADRLAIFAYGLGAGANADVVVVWNTVSGRWYTVLTTTNFAASWTNVPDPAYLRLTGAGLPAGYTNTQSDARYLRIKVEKP